MPTTQKERLHILLADDDADDRELFLEALTGSGHNVELSMVTDGEQLSNAIAGLKMPPPPHMIFLDINMPRKNGKACLVEIRNNSNFDHIPVIMFSTSNSERDVDETYRNGASRYINKSDFFRNEYLMLQKLFSFDEGQLVKPPSKADFIFALG
jgi:CheY-like chemotaxis protein